MSLRVGIYLCLFETSLFEDKTGLHWFFLIIFIALLSIILRLDERRNEDISSLDFFRRSAKCSLFDGHSAMRLGLVALVLVLSRSWGFVLEGIGKSADR